MKKTTNSFIVISLVLASFGYANDEIDALKIQAILRETSGDIRAQAERLERLAALSPSSPTAQVALLLASSCRNRLETDDDNTKEKNDALQVIKSSQPGTWLNIEASLDLAYAHHQNGEHDKIITLVEKMLQGSPGGAVKSQLNSIPPAVSDMFGMKPATFDAEGYNDTFRHLLAIAYKRRGRDKEALRVFNEMKDAKIKGFIADEINEDVSNGRIAIPETKPPVPVPQKSEIQAEEAPSFHQPQQREEPKVLSPVVSANASPKYDIWTWFPWVLSVTLALGWVMWSLVRKNK